MDGARHTFEHHLGEIAGQVEGLVAAWLGASPQAGEAARPARLMAAMRHAALGGGKRLRPFLTMAAARLFTAREERLHAALAVAGAIELLHCYSLVHDDLPSMDDDDLRRGRPTVHRAFDEATAILAGDALLTLAFEKIAEPFAAIDPGTGLALVTGLARASGLGGMIGGQMLDLAAEGRFGDAAPGAEATRLLQSMKTGALIAFSAEAGAMAAGASQRDRAVLRRYGEALGAAFQIADDILDRQSTPEALGKATAKDADKGKATLVDLIGMDAAMRERDRLAEEAKTTLSPFGETAQPLMEAARFTASRTK